MFEKKPKEDESDKVSKDKFWSIFHIQQFVVKKIPDKPYKNSNTIT
jgi:predicted nucleic acid-binding protein